MEIHVLHRQGQSICAIAQQLRVSRNTVCRNVRDLIVVPRYPDRVQQATKSDPYKADVLGKQTVESVFGIIKQVMGVRQFSMRGLDKVAGE